MITPDLLRPRRTAADLRSSGAASAARSRPAGLTGRSTWQQVRQRYETLRRDGRLPATLKWCSATPGRFRPTTADGRSVIQFRPRDDF